VKILTILGARPQFIKASVVSHAIKEYNTARGAPCIVESIVHTGQHFDFNMSEVFFRELGIPSPAYHLGIGGLGHAAMTGRMLEHIDEVLVRDCPDVMLVYGDTNSTLAGALVAAKRHIPVAHVEAGVRSFNRRMPEEINRIVTDHISHWLFCPTSAALDNLRREGIDRMGLAEVSLVGDVMYDASLAYRQSAKPTTAIKELIDQMGDGYYVATTHREENTTVGEGPHRFEAIISALDEIATQTPVVMPVHPRIRSAIAQQSIRHIRVLDPVGYFDMVALIAGCTAVITDSGGMQKEAYFFGKPCLILRDETEWTELISERCGILVGSDPDRILKGEADVRAGRVKVSGRSLYGHGDASKRIVEILGSGR
jgi:UDP-GlcNAc3NAcA epimerase